MLDALDDLERYLLDDDGLPPLVRIALIHAQFEIIHPFLDGNDRVGRMLITLLLCQQRILSQPFLYLSQYFKRNRVEYYERLMAVRNDGEWTDWIRFFLCGVIEIAAESSNSIRRIEALRQEALTKTDNLDSRLTLYSRQLIDQLFITPQVTYVNIEQLLQVTRYSASALLCRFSDKLGILVEATPDRAKGKRYLFKDYLDILEVGTT